jgi:general secretion pathway protein K
MAVLAVGMTTEQQIGIRRTENLFEGDQAMLMARGMEEWTVQILTRDLQGSGRDHLGEDWALGLLPTPTKNGMVAGRVEDLQARININNLLDGDGESRTAEVTRQRLKRLYTLCEIDSVMVDALDDWLDDDIDKRPDGAEDDDYLFKDIPYRSANRMMTSITELVLVEGMTQEYFQCLRPNVAALPVTTGINVNTAGAMVLASIGDGLALADAKEIVKDRPEDGYKTVADFLSHPSLINSVVDPEGLVLESNHFQLSGQAFFGRSEVLLYSSLAREGGRVRIFRHSIGAY